MRENPRSDEALVGAVVANGDERAFGALYDRHTQYLYRLALRLSGGDASAAEDLVHDAWVQAALRFSTFEGRAAFRTWLAGFVVNAARRAWRREGRSDELDVELAADDEALLATADRLDLDRAMAKLPPRARQVLVLHDLEGWTHEAIAERLGIEPGTSKSQLSRARALMRRELGENESEEP